MPGVGDTNTRSKQVQAAAQQYRVSLFSTCMLADDQENLSGDMPSNKAKRALSRRFFSGPVLPDKTHHAYSFDVGQGT